MKNCNWLSINDSVGLTTHLLCQRQIRILLPAKVNGAMFQGKFVHFHRFGASYFLIDLSNFHTSCQLINTYSLQRI